MTVINGPLEMAAPFVFDERSVAFVNGVQHPHASIEAANLAIHPGKRARTLLVWAIVNTVPTICVYTGGVANTDLKTVISVTDIAALKQEINALKNATPPPAAPAGVTWKDNVTPIISVTGGVVSLTNNPVAVWNGSEVPYAPQSHPALAAIPDGHYQQVFLLFFEDGDTGVATGASSKTTPAPPAYSGNAVVGASFIYSSIGQAITKADNFIQDQLSNAYGFIDILNEWKELFTEPVSGNLHFRGTKMLKVGDTLSVTPEVVAAMIEGITYIPTLVKNEQGEPVFGTSTETMNVFAPLATIEYLKEAVAGTTVNGISVTWNTDGSVTLSGQPGQMANTMALGKPLGINAQRTAVGRRSWECQSDNDNSATWIYNTRSPVLDSADPHDSAVIAQLAAAVWDNEDRTTIAARSVRGDMHTAYTGYLYVCVDAGNTWLRIAKPPTVDGFISADSSSCTKLTTALVSHDFTSGAYNALTDAAAGYTNADIRGMQLQKFYDPATRITYECKQSNGAGIIWDIN